MSANPTLSVAMSSTDLRHLRRALFTEDGHENFAVVLGGLSATRTERRLLVREIWPAPQSAYTQRLAYHLEIAPSFLNAIVDRCLATDLHPVIIHSHPMKGRARYSPSDDFGESRLLPVLNDLLPRTQPASMLMTEEDLVGRVRVGKSFAPIHQIAVRGLGAYTFGHRSGDPAKPGEAFERQVRAIGHEGHARLTGLRVGIVGLGGTGSLVAEQVVRLGVRSLTLVDFDAVEESNLSRMWGARGEDARKNRLKVEVIARHLKTLRPKLAITTLADSVVRQQVLQQLRDCDLVFSCTDNHLSRAMLNRFAHQYIIPVVDMGVRLDARAGRVTAVGGRATLVGAGLACLRCSGHINPEQVRVESLPPAEREQLAREGYVQGVGDPAPAVVSLNATVAGLAVTAAVGMFVNLVGQDPPLDQIYDATHASLFPVATRHKEGCEVCSATVGLKGLGDLQIVSAYA